jgi:hypothetical protein
MTKLTREQKAFRKALKENVEGAGGEIFSFAEEGLTVVVVPAMPGNLGSEFVHVAIAQCDFKDDEFKRKRGEYIALERLNCGAFWAVPVAARFNEEIAEAVRDMMFD